MDGFWMEVERTQQRGEVKKEDCGGGRSQLLEGEASWACELGQVGCSGLIPREATC